MPIPNQYSEKCIKKCHFVPPQYGGWHINAHILVVGQNALLDGGTAQRERVTFCATHDLWPPCTNIAKYDCTISAHTHSSHKYCEMCLHTQSAHECCRVAAQKLPNITARLRHNSPNIGKYIPTSSRDNVGNGTFYCNNTSLMADMETERANGIWAGVSNLSKRVHWICSMSAGGSVDLFMPLVNQDCGNLTLLKWEGANNRLPAKSLRGAYLQRVSASQPASQAGQRTKCR